MRPKKILFFMLCVLWIFPATVLCKENQAMVLLKAMSAYVGEQQTIELSFDSDIEIITPQLEKIPFTNIEMMKSADARLGRPATPVSYAGVARRTTVRVATPGGGAPGVGVTPGVGVGAPGAGVRPANVGGPVNRVGVR